MAYTYDLTLGLPHTNHRFFAEPLMLKYAGHFQWQSIAAAAGLPLSALRTADGGEVYASFYYIEIVIPDAAPLESFRLDDTVRFAIDLRAFKNIAFEGRLHFDRPENLGDASPAIRFANIFITPEKGNSRLRVAPPAQADFRALPPLPNEENPYQLTRAASETGTLGLVDDWESLTTVEHRYDIDVDRDTNGAGLVYFANYVAFMDTAERLAARDVAKERSLRHRRIAYYGNADVDDTLTIAVTVLRSAAHPNALGFKYAIRREEDGETICLSEAIKAVA
ncbi:MAG TPA: LnmK family bifunctional acyltransferase/decarboxylase [Thermoanaerobaculia bacterium]|nr:LnmK family bifunctional acyltransferase/decarboxylase [Thermoanaerobaculia bacterium]